LEFDTRYQPFSKAANVIYSKTYAIMDPGELITEKHSEYKFPALSALITKSDAWKYEREWRIINEQGGISIEFHPAALTGIYFGCKMSAEHMEIIEMILKDYPVKLYEMKQSMTKFKVIAQKYTNESDAVLEVKDWLVRRVHI
jgi:hypothetical protein